jgi:hypothetical protein
MEKMKEPINFDKLENYILMDFKQDDIPKYKINALERVGIGARKFWVVPESAPTHGLQFVIYWQSNPMSEPIDTVEVEMYKNLAGMVRSTKHRYNLKRNNIKSIDDFTLWVKDVIRDFEPELSTEI